MRLSLATFNVQNLRPQPERARLRRIARVIAEDLEAPDVVALQEVSAPHAGEAVGALPAVALFDALQEEFAVVGCAPYAALEVAPSGDEDGGQPGLSIRCAMLYRPTRLKLEPWPNQQVLLDPALRHNPSRILDYHPAFSGDPLRRYTPGRKPLVARFTAEDRSLTVICCHLKSQRGADRPARQQARKQRHLQASLLSTFIDRTCLGDDPQSVVLLGDFNDTPGSKTLETLKGEHLYNLMETVPKRSRYTRRRAGRPQALDHILVSRDLLSGATLRIPHLNSDAPANARCSDHDPVLAQIEW